MLGEAVLAQEALERRGPHVADRQETQVLVEARRDSNGMQRGLCEEYFAVSFEAEEDLTGRMVRVLLEKVNETGAHGRLIEDCPKR